MQFEWDPEKARSNLLKHGVSFEAVNEFEWERHVLTPDRRFDYGEIRHKALGKINGRVHALIFAETIEGMRLVSLRKANSREVRFYERNI